MNDLINPLMECNIGHCPHCGNPLLLVDSEMTYMELNEEGVPIDCEVSYTRVEGVCYTCGAKIPYKRAGMKYVPYNKLFDPIINNNIKINVKEKPVESNPFIK